MDKNNLKQFFKNRILWEIYVIWFFRRIVPLMAIQILILVLGLKIFAKNVFVAKVLENAAGTANSNYWAFFKYLISSFFQAHLIVQITILVVLGIMALLLRDLGRIVLTYFATFRGRNQNQAI